MKEPAITMPRLQTIAKQMRIWWRRRLRRWRQAACMRSSVPVGQRTLHFARRPRRSKRRNPKAYLRSKWRLPPSTPSLKARARGFSASRTSPIPWAAWDKTSKRARRTEPVTPCKFSKRLCDRVRFEPILRQSCTRHLWQSAFVPEIFSHVIERALKSRADVFDFSGFDHQRRSEHQTVAHHAQQQPVALRRGLDSRTDVEPGVEGNAAFAVTHQLHAEDEAHPLHVADQRMRLEPAERRLQHGAEALGATDDG